MDDMTDVFARFWNRVRAAVLLAVGCVVAEPAPASAQVQHDAQVWAQVISTLTLSDWRIHLEVQPRFSQDASELDHTLTRWALGRQLNSRMSVWAGHAWTARTLGDTTRHEQRLWQQLSLTLPAAAGWAPSVRVRLEQRFFDGWSDNSHRLRSMLRGVRPISGPWSLAVWDEFMLNFDQTGGGPHQGYDQNRAFAGVLRRFSRHASLEFGYLLQSLKTPAGPMLNGHTAFTWLNLTF
jgi:hypothetical protein